MAANNFKLFDENKQNMLSDQEYQASQQRLGGVQAGIASSMLNNKFAYQMSLIAYAIAQMMNANGYDATDALAVSAFVGNLSNSVLQKVIDKATTAEARAGTNTLKWMTPALVKSFFDYQLATQAEAQAGSIDTKWMSPAKVKAFYNYWKATASEATEGTNDTKWMSPLKVAQAVAPVVNASWVLLNEYTIAGSYIWTAPDLFNGKSYKIGVMVIGGGGSGGASIYSRTLKGTSANASGGASGYSKALYLKVNPGGRYNLVVGAGGTGAVRTITTASNETFTDGNPGLSSSFNGVTVSGGGGGRGGDYIGAIGGQPSRCPTVDDDTVNPFGGIPVYTKSGVLTDPDFVGCFNPFTFMRFLGAGGSAVVYTNDSGSTTVRTTPGGRDPLTNVGGSDGAARHIDGLSSNITLYGKTPTSPGCGSGGAALKTNGNSGGYTLTATSDAGADGAVMIYVMGVKA